MPRLLTLALALIVLVAPVAAQQQPNPDHIHPDNIDWSPSWGVTGWTMDLALTAFTLSPTGAISFDVDQAVDDVFQLYDFDGSIWISLDLGTPDLLSITETATTDLSIGNSTGDVLITSDDVSIVLTDTADDALQITDGTVVLLDIDLGTDAITLGDPGDPFTLDGLTLTLTSAGVLAATSVGASSWANTSGNLTLSTVTSGTLGLDGVALVDLNAGANLDIDCTGDTTLDATGILSLASVGASDWTNDTGNLTIETTTSGTLDLDSAAAMTVGTGATSLVIGGTGVNVEIDGPAQTDEGIICGASLDWDANVASETVTIDSTIGLTRGTGLVSITDLVTGTDNDTVAEASLWIDADGTYALAVADGAVAVESVIDTYAAGPLSLGATTANSVVIDDVTVTAAAVTGVDSITGLAGQFDIDAAAGSGGAGSAIEISGGLGDANSAGGPATLVGGRGTGTGVGGAAYLYGGSAGTAGAVSTGGAAYVYGGSSLDAFHTAGSTYIDAGSNAAGGAVGTINIGTDANRADIVNIGHASFGDSVIFASTIDANESIDWDGSEVGDVVTIDSTDVATTTGLVTITDLRAGANNDSLAEASLRVVSSGTYAVDVSAGAFNAALPLQTESNVGTGAFTETEYGDGYMHTTVVSAVSLVDAVTAGGTETVGGAVYTFPEGAIAIHSVLIDLTVADVNDNSDTPELSLGSVAGDGNGTQTGTEEDILVGAATGATTSAGTDVHRNGSPGGGAGTIFDGTASAVVVYLNCDDNTWTGAENITLAGTITIVWSYLGDY